jgi:hypothetical protein
MNSFRFTLGKFCDAADSGLSEERGAKMSSDPGMSLARFAGQTVAAAAVTDAWEAARYRLARLVGRGDARRADMVGRWLSQTRDQLTAADSDAEPAWQVQAERWAVRFSDLMKEDPGIEAELRAVVTEIATGLPAWAGQSLAAGRDVAITASGRGIAAGLIHGGMVISGSQGVQAGDHSTQVNYFIGVYPGPAGGEPAGELLAKLTDPFALEVHRPVQAGSQQPLLSALPAYVRRGHDLEVAEVVRAAASGESGIAVLVGGSSTGKTRACWEALQLLRRQDGPWRLWHPLEPSRPEAALRELSSIGPRTVVWLNEAQDYLGAADGLGERIAAGLRKALRDTARAPVLVLATLWPEHWDMLIARPPAGTNPHAQARELLTGRAVSVPAAFTADELRMLPAAGDPRLALAAELAEDGQVTQFLAGAPEVMARYRNAPPAARAVIDAAVDARRLGHGPALPLALLADAAPGYLSDAEWDALGDNWLEQAIAYASKPCNGARGPITPIRPRTGLGRARRGERAVEVRYRLADYLEQAGRLERDGQLPPAQFWDAAAFHATGRDRLGIGESAARLGLYRHAASLWGRSAASGEPAAAVEFFKLIRRLNPEAVSHVGSWVAERITVDSPREVIPLLAQLERHEQRTGPAVTTLANRCAAHAALPDAETFDQLLMTLVRVDADQAVIILKDREEAKAAGWPECGSSGWIKAELRKVGRHIPWKWEIFESFGVYKSPSDLYDFALTELRAAGADQAAEELAEHVARRADLNSPSQVTAERQLEASAVGLITHDPAEHVPLDSAGWASLSRLAEELRAAGDAQAATRLALSILGQAPSKSTEGWERIVWSLKELHDARQGGELFAVADRLAGEIPVQHSPEVLRALCAAGADHAAYILLHRAANSAIPISPDIYGDPIEYKAPNFFTLLAEATLPPSAAARFLRFGREPDDTLSPPWTWADAVSGDAINQPSQDRAASSEKLGEKIRKWPEGWPGDFPIPLSAYI